MTQAAAAFINEDRKIHGRVFLGRRPATIRWTPSKPIPWWAAVWQEGRRFTAEQEQALIALGRDPVTAEALEVVREIDLYADEAGGVLRIGELRPVYAFDCPVIGKGAAGKVRVIGPNGKPRDVQPDGWANKPHPKPYRGAW